MPVRSEPTVKGGRLLLFFCDHPGCGEPACFGHGVTSIRAAWDSGNVAALGKWYCLKHDPVLGNAFLTPEAQSAPETNPEAPHEPQAAGDGPDADVDQPSLF